MASTVKLSAESKYGYSGQYIARILGRAAKVQFNREFCGNKSGKRGDVTSYETDETGLYETCDVTKHGKEKFYCLVLPWREGIVRLTSDHEDALAIAKRLDGGERLEEIAIVELGDEITEAVYATRCNECHAKVGESGKCPDHSEASTSNHCAQELKLKDDGTPARRLVYVIRKPGEAKKAAAAATLDTAVDAIVDTLLALPHPLQKQALKLAKDRLFPKARETPEPTGGEQS